MRINHNISALNTRRHLVTNTQAQAKNLERLSSGLKINRGADGPAQLIISERLRTQQASLKQAIDNNEAGVTVLQTAEGALSEANRSLIHIRELAVHAANEAVNDEFMLQADQQEIDHVLAQVDRIARTANYGKKALLDGSMGANGVTTGANLEFISATELTDTSPLGGYEVLIKRAAARSEVFGEKALTRNIVDSEEQITLLEGGKTLNFKTTAGDSVETTLNKLDKAIRQSGLDLELIKPEGAAMSPDEPQFLNIRHKKYGSEFQFEVASTTSGLLSAKADIYDTINSGEDIAGTVGGEEAFGRGQVLTGAAPTKISGMKLRYSSEEIPEGGFVGTVTFAQGSQHFQIGPDADHNVRFSLRAISTHRLGQGVDNGSDYGSLHDIDVTTQRGAEDTMRIVDRAIEELSVFRGDMGAFQKNILESNLNFLRQAHEEISNAESVIRDADMAEEMSAFTRNQIMVSSSTAMLAQANQTPMSVMSLLQS